MRFLYKSIFTLFGVFILFTIPVTTQRENLEVYYDSVDFNLNVNDPLRKRFLIQLEPKNLLEVIPPGRNYVVKKLNVSSETVSIEQMGKDNYPIWIAYFKDDHITSIEQYRRSDLEPFVSGSFQKRYVFRISSQIDYIESFELKNGKNLQKKEVYDYDEHFGYLTSVSTYVNSILTGREAYNYDRDHLVKKSYYLTDSRTNDLTLFYYVDFKEDYIDGMKKVTLSFFDKEDNKFKSLIQYFYDGQLVFSESSLGVRNVYNYDQNKELVQTLFLNEKSEPIKTTNYYFRRDLDAGLGDIEKTLSKKHLEFLKNVYYQADSAVLKEEIFEYNPFGELSNWVVFTEKRGQTAVSKSPIFNDTTYEYLYDSEHRIISKRILTTDNFVLGKYDYSYNAKELLESETLTDSASRVMNKIKYFYDDVAGDSPLDPLKKNDKKSREELLSPDAFYLSYNTLMDSLLEEKKNSRLRDPQSENNKRKLVKNLIYAYENHLKKVVFYGERGQIRSYVRLQSEKDRDGHIYLRIFLYGGDINLPFRENPINKYQESPYINIDNIRDKSAFEADYYKEFNTKASDTVGRLGEKLRRSLFFKIEEESVSEAIEIDFDDNGNINKENRYVRGEKVVVKRPKTEDELLIGEFIKRLKNPDI